MGFEVSHDDVVITDFMNKAKVWCEIGRAAGNMEDVNMNIDGDIVDGICNGEVLRDEVSGKRESEEK